MRRNTRTCRNSLITTGLLLIHTLFLYACNDSKEKAPIDRYKMKEILIDIHLAEAYSGLIPNDSFRMPQLNSKNKDTLAKLYTAILAKHQITMEELNKALSWYGNRPGENDSVYALVVPYFDSLKALPDSLLRQQ